MSLDDPKTKPMPPETRHCRDPTLTPPGFWAKAAVARAPDRAMVETPTSVEIRRRIITPLARNMAARTVSPLPDADRLQIVDALASPRFDSDDLQISGSNK